MRNNAPKFRPQVSGRIILAVIIVTSATGGFVLGYFVGKNAASPDRAQALRSQPDSNVTASSQGATQPQTESTAAEPSGQKPPAEQAKPAENPQNQTKPAPVEPPAQKKEPAQEAKSIGQPTDNGSSAGQSTNKAEKAKAASSSNALILYTVQAGAFKSKKEAEALVKRLETKGYKAYIKEENNSKGGSVFKVRTGEFSDKKKAEMLVIKLKKAEGLNAFVARQNN